MKQNQIYSPKIGSIVCEVKTGKDVYIVSGNYMVDGRTSNWWEWREVLPNGELGRLKKGYGWFVKSNNKYIIKIVAKRIID